MNHFNRFKTREMFYRVKTEPFFCRVNGYFDTDISSLLRVAGRVNGCPGTDMYSSLRVAAGGPARMGPLSRVPLSRQYGMYTSRNGT
jgi:hypothetical protein